MDYVLSYNWKSERAFQRCPQNDGSFEHWFWAVSLYEDGYKLVEVPYLGMEHQSSITYGNNKYMKGYSRSGFVGYGTEVDFIIIHESGHECLLTISPKDTLPICGFTKDSRIT
jgi:hypothetical protein